MAWRRLYITVEGPTERRFADDVLKPHLANYSIDVRSRVVVTNRKLGKRGGIFDFTKIRDDLKRLMQDDGTDEASFTTMVDLYALPAAFPGWVEASRKATAAQRVAVLEAAFQAELSDDRFLPHIQLHEFEALLYCDLSQLRSRIPNSDRAIGVLAREVAGIAPEDIDEGATTAPSKRIIRHLPIYEKTKVRIGAPAAAAIGLPALCQRCPHFGAWIESLEALGEPLL